MKKQHINKKSTLTLRREHIRTLTPTDLQKAAGGAACTEGPNEPTGSDFCGLATVIQKACK
jgi:hypothetical protein